MAQAGLHAEHEYDPFIKWVSCVNLNMTCTHLTSTHDLFINELVVLGSRVVSDFVTPTKDQISRTPTWPTLFVTRISH